MTMVHSMVTSSRLPLPNLPNDDNEIPFIIDPNSLILRIWIRLIIKTQSSIVNANGLTASSAEIPSLSCVLNTNKERNSRKIYYTCDKMIFLVTDITFLTNIFLTGFFN